MHIIETGEVLIINDEGKSISKLSKSDHFGMCDILRMVGPEYFGQMRAGLECVQTFFIPYKKLKHRLSFVEKVKLKSVKLVDR